MESVPPSIIATLKKAHQEHVLKYISSPGITEQERQKLYKQVFLTIYLFTI